jgi:hypothetical protein
MAGVDLSARFEQVRERAKVAPDAFAVAAIEPAESAVLSGTYYQTRAALLNP